MLFAQRLRCILGVIKEAAQRVVATAHANSLIDGASHFNSGRRGLRLLGPLEGHGVPGRGGHSPGVKFARVRHKQALSLNILQDIVIYGQRVRICLGGAP